MYISNFLRHNKYLNKLPIILLMKIGIDFGGTLYKLESNVISINMKDAIEVLNILKDNGHELYLISYCRQDRSNKIHNYLVKSKFINLFDKEFYVTDPKYKSFICNYIGCHIMIDDRQNILDNIKLNNKNITTILVDEEKTHKSSDHLVVSNWKEILRAIDNIKILNYMDKDISINVDKYLIYPKSY